MSTMKDVVAWQYWSHGGWRTINADDVAKAKRLINDGQMDPGHLRALYTHPPQPLSAAEVAEDERPVYYAHKIERSLDDSEDEYPALHRAFLRKLADMLRRLAASPAVATQQTGAVAWRWVSPSGRPWEWMNIADEPAPDGYPFADTGYRIEYAYTSPGARVDELRSAWSVASPYLAMYGPDEIYVRLNKAIAALNAGETK